MSAPARATPGSDRLALQHRRLAVGMGLAAIVAFSAGVGWTESAPLAAGALLLFTLFWRTSPALSARLEHLWLPLALLLMARAAYYVVVVGGDVVIPVVDLLLLLMCAEALRSLDTFNDVRLYGLSFALLLAATAYRPGVVFAGAFVAYVALASPALMAGYFRRTVRRHGAVEEPLGPRLVRSAWALSGVTVLASVLVFLVFPRTSQGWAARGDTPALSMAGFSDQVSLGAWGSSIQPNPAVVLRVEFPEGRPVGYEGLHWRGRSFDRFDGVTWTRSRRIGPSGGLDTWYRDRWPGRPLTQRIYAEPLDARVLFGVHPIVSLTPESQIHPLMDNVGDLGYWGGAQPVYSAQSMVTPPSPAELREARGNYRPDDNYRQLPRGVSPRILALADSLTRGLETRYDRVQRIESWLQSEFGYTLQLPATAREATLEHFLFERRAGHCEYFSTAMVVLLRAAGIEARNVTGFLGGSWSDVGDYLVVTQNEAHSWVEVWFPSYGWVTFDPTPAGGGPAAAASVWMWPGRMVFDAIQHRWGKWVLDYGLVDQWDAIGRAMDAIREAGEASEPGTGRWSLLWLLVAAAFGGVALALRLRRAPAGEAETRLYLRLVESCRRAGLVRGQVAPLELIEHLATAGGAASTPGRRLVQLYLRARFAGETLGDPERAEMARALRMVRRALSRRDAAAGAGA